MAACRQLHRRRGDRLSAAGGAIGLRDDQPDLVSHGKEPLERGNGKGRTAHEDEAHRRPRISNDQWETGH
jgi:hypothetical protein